MVTLVFSALDWKYSFGQIWSKKSNLPIKNEPWHLDWLEYAELDGDIYYISLGKQIFILENKCRTLESCDRDGNDTLLNAWMVWFKCFNIPSSPFMYACNKSA